MELLDAVLAAKIAKGTPGSDVTPASIINATANMNPEQKTATRTNLGVPANSDAEVYSSLSIYQNADVNQNKPADQIIFSPSSATDSSVLSLEGDQSQNVVLRGLADPVFSSDAVNKAYVDGKQLVVTVTYNDQNSTYSANKTFAEMAAARAAGKTLVVTDGDIFYPLFSYDTATFVFSATNTVELRDGNITVNYRFNCEEDDSWGYVESFSDPGTREISITGTAPTITPAANTIYNCGELTSLTISNPPATGSYSIVFTSGTTATTTTIPATILGLEDFAAEANTLYEINVLDNRAVVGSWAVSA